MRSGSDNRDVDDSATDAGSLRTEKEGEDGDVSDDEDAGDDEDGEDDDDNDVSDVFDDTGSTRVDDNGDFDGDVDDADDDRDDDDDGTVDGSRTIMVDTNVNGNDGNDGLVEAIPTSPFNADDRDIVDDIGTTNVE